MLRKHSPAGSRLRLLAWGAALATVACFGPDDKAPKESPAQDLPVITAQPRDTAVAAGQPALFTVTATGALSYQWIRLPSDTLEGEVLSGLLIPEADSSQDSASYVCLVRNLKGTVATRAAVLRVTAPADSDTIAHPPVARNCAENPVAFTHPLIDPAALKVVAPIGQVGGGNTEIIGRSYVFPKDDRTGARLPLTAPADLEVVAAGHYLPPGAPTVAQGYDPDWVLLIDLGCGLHIELYHVKGVADSIKAAMFDTAITDKSGYLQLRHKVAFKAGEPFGAYVKGLNSGAFDFILRSDSVTNRFANQARYEAGPSNLLHVVCPYDLFQGATKAAYYALLGTVTGVPIPGATCGTVERDKIGTPAGQWFFDSAFALGTLSPNRKDGFYGDPLPIVLGPDSTVYIGHTGPTDNLRIDHSNPTWKDPGDITGEWCYQLYDNPSAPNGWLRLRMTAPLKMDAAFGAAGSCPGSFPGSGFRTYYR